MTDPHHRDRLAAVVSGTDIVVATSGVAERGAHVFNPFTGRPATGLSSVTIVGPDIVTADVYATAALAMESAAPTWLEGMTGYQAMTIDSDGTRWTTPGFGQFLDEDVADGA